MAAGALACNVSLEAFEAYAVKLHGLLGGGAELVADALSSLLACAGGEAAETRRVVDWCLHGDGLAGGGPESVARALLLQRAMGGCGPRVDGVGAPLLATAPRVLAAAPAPVAERISEAVAWELQDDEARAVAWLRGLRPGAADGGEVVEGATAYCRAAEALLARYPGGALRSEAWAAAEAISTGVDSAERRVCAQLLLPPLVRATDDAEAARRLSGFVGALLDGGSRADIADALALGVAFHGPLLALWRLGSLTGEHDGTGERLIECGLRFGLKENASLRRQARFLLEASAREALAAPDAERTLQQVAGISAAEVQGAWKAFWEFADTLEEFSSHLLKSSWDTLMGRMMQFLGRLAAKPEGPPGGRWPPAMMSPHWLEVLLCRALAHDNDSVHKFVLGQLVALDQGVARLSETFVLEEMLERFSHSIDILYPRSDVHQAFEKRTAAFFVAFVERHAEGPAAAARRLLHATLKGQTPHHTPMRLLLSVLCQVSAPGALQPEEALEVVEHFFADVLTRMPVSVRPWLARLALSVAQQLCGDGGAAAQAPGLARAAAGIPDGLLDDLRAPLAALALRVCGCGGDGVAALVGELLRGLASAHGPDVVASSPVEAVGRRASPTEAARLVLGAVRVLGALGTARPCGAVVWPAIAEAAEDAHRRAYLPRRAACTALLGAAYGAVLLPDGAETLDARPGARAELLALAGTRAQRAMSADAAGVEDEAPWLWLYALALDKLWRPGLPHGEAALASAEAALGGARGAAPDVGRALRVAAAAAVVGAVAPRMADAARRAGALLLLWQSHVEKPASVRDSRFSVVAAGDAAAWPRNRLEEYEDLHRPAREGPGRVLEWRDVVASFLLAKWRALAALVQTPGIVEAIAQEEPAALGRRGALADGLLDELEALQPPHVAFWAPVARRAAYPAVFAAGARPEGEQREALQRLCMQLRGSITEGTGDGSLYMPRGCMAELAAALCDPQLCDAELRLYADGPGPVTAAALALLSAGEVAVGISRAAAVPALAALLAAGRGPGAAAVLAALLLHREATIVDGALSCAPDAAAGVVDEAGPGGAEALAAICPEAAALARKFRGTSGLPRVLALAGLDAVAGRALAAGTGFSEIVGATLERVLVVLRETLAQLLNPPGAKKVSQSRPPTPMPMSSQHRTQLRGWQAVLVLGAHADRAFAERMLPELFHHLAVPHVPDVRDCQELLGCALCALHEDLVVEPLLVPALANFDAQTQVSASLLVLASFLFKRWSTVAAAGDGAGAGLDLRRIAALVRAVAPYLSHNSAYVRGTAAWGFYEIFEALGAPRLTEHLPAGDAALVADLYRFVAGNKECKKMRGRLKPVFAGVEPGEPAMLSRLLELSQVLPPSAGEPAEPMAVPAASPLYLFTDGELQPTATFLNTLKDEVAAEMEDLWERSDVTQYPSCSDNWQLTIDAALAGAPAAADGAADAAADAARGDAAAVGTQRKFVPPAPPVPPEGADGSGAAAAVGVRRRLPLVVIGSLIDKTPNLAGLCRTCEVFNCEAVCLANAKITKDQSFQSMSVTAEKWLPIREVTRAGLADYLRELRRRGYAIVGIEQTHNSIAMDEFTFPENAAILLGAEKEGIDAELLPLLDSCVEIPQAGQLRSLNVHVSGSLAVWEYTRQSRAGLVAAT